MTTTESRPGTEAAPFPLGERFPRLAALPRAPLGRHASPLERLEVPGTRAPLWIKRDDLNAPLAGGNKIRALELLLGGVHAGDTVLTLGGEGSTHVLATALLAERLGARTFALRWRHEMHAAAHAADARARAHCARLVTVPGGAVVALAALPVVALALRLSGARPRVIPIGGSTPLGILGHANGALELAAQVARGECPAPARVVVPLGSGGTAAGLALGFAIAGLATTVTGVRVAPRLATNRARTARLAHAARRLIERHEGTALALPSLRLEVRHEAYGGAYGRPLAEGAAAAATLHALGGPMLEATYTEKAAATALALVRQEEGPVMLWMTYDARMVEGIA